MGQAETKHKGNGEEGQNPSSPSVLSSSLMRRLLLDTFARYFVSLGGYFVIFSILAIVLVIIVEVIPLFSPVSLIPDTSFASGSEFGAGGGMPVVPGELNAIVLDEYREVATVIDAKRAEVRSYRIAIPGADGTPSNIKQGEAIQTEAIPLLEGETLTSVSEAKAGNFLLGTSRGAVLPLSVKYTASFSGDIRTVTPEVRFLERIALLPEVPAESPSAGTSEDSGTSETKSATEVEGSEPSEAAPGSLSQSLAGVDVLSHSPSREIIVAALSSGKTLIRSEKRKRSLMGPAKVSVTLSELDLSSIVAPISELNVTSNGQLLIGGSADGVLFAADIRGGEAGEVFTLATGGTIRATALLLGEQTLVVGDEEGNVTSYALRRTMSEKKVSLRKLHSFEPHGDAIRSFSTSSRNKTFTSMAKNGELAVHYGTSGQTLADRALGAGVIDHTLTLKSDGVAILKETGTIDVLALDNPHPEATFRTLFLPVQYEGKDESELIWQSTGGSDEFEPKFSVTPLLFGTLKGTLYALLFSVPVAVLAALYTSQFMPSRIKRIVKPLVELMAALPSVVIGFLGGLWLAPRLDGYLLAVFLFPLSLIVGSIIAMSLWRQVPSSSRVAKWAGGPIAFLVFGISFGLFGAVYLGSFFEQLFFGGDIQTALRSTFGIVYDQRNSIVVGIAMGFAVVPIIFTISEDCLSSVPKGLIAASLALGANRWQTALRVVLPSASPGIFSAVMIGFGRAIGETMIVLMATGNTPLIDLSAFNGFRAMSANIAVELPEAPHGGTLYRILFLTAFLLFVFTFVVNTLSESVRLRLRKKYEAG